MLKETSLKSELWKKQWMYNGAFLKSLSKWQRSMTIWCRCLSEQSLAAQKSQTLSLSVSAKTQLNWVLTCMQTVWTKIRRLDFNRSHQGQLCILSKYTSRPQYRWLVYEVMTVLFSFTYISGIIPSECQIVLNQIRPHVLSGLIWWVQVVCVTGHGEQEQ